MVLYLFYGGPIELFKIYAGLKKGFIENIYGLIVLINCEEIYIWFYKLNKVTPATRGATNY